MSDAGISRGELEVGELFCDAIIDFLFKTKIHGIGLVAHEQFLIISVSGKCLKVFGFFEASALAWEIELLELAVVALQAAGVLTSGDLRLLLQNSDEMVRLISHCVAA
ncbi:hypothetical protein [Burkholderia ubonensis]|uniref:hypothetical protein n=1 Tax=Burkholderia ubonensis TaxID=101571 RepID=UPI000B248D48|nr:hypothetical protein [Burkholderia ubonensis]